MKIIAMLLIGIGLHELFSNDAEKPAQNLQETPESDSIKVESKIDANNGVNQNKGENADDTPNTDGNSGCVAVRQASEEIHLTPDLPAETEIVENVENQTKE